MLHIGDWNRTKILINLVSKEAKMFIKQSCSGARKVLLSTRLLGAIFLNSATPNLELRLRPLFVPFG